MSQRTCAVASLTFVLFVAMRSLAPAAENYVIFPVRTPLQQALLSPRNNAYAMIYANGVIEGGKFSPELLEIDSFKRDLASLAADGADSIIVYYQFENWNPNEAAEKQLFETVEKVCGDCGFKRIGQGRTYAGGGWQESKRIVDEADRSDDANEPFFVNEHARAYPVRTALSRFLTDDADCYVVIRRPFDGRHDQVAPEVEQSIAELLSQCNLKRKRKILFYVTSTTAGASVAERFMSPDVDSTTTAAALARRLGFETGSVRHSPCGGAPERPLGQRVPDCSLPGMNGDTISLAEMIDGKVALVTFWGLACGPCRVEAPRLTAVHERYADKGFTVVAINAYDDSAEAVSQYVHAEGLRHPMLLKGSQAARDQFFVGAYPTSFWIDRNGQVVDYVIGDESEEELAHTIERMLGQSKSSSKSD